MRPGQNKRMRGRSNNNNSNNNRKGPNPLTRSYESNGPDVKIRGTAQHVAEKYLQLARDAQSSGDPVMAESYLQHAEHYFRIIATAQQAQQQQTGFNRQQNDNQQNGDDSFDDDDIHDRFASPAERAQAILNQPQPSVGQQGNPFGTQQRDNNGDEASGGDRQERGDRIERQERSDRTERQERNPDRNQDRNQDRNGGRNNHRRQRSFDNQDGRNRPVRPENENAERPARVDQPRAADQDRTGDHGRPARFQANNDAPDDDQPMLPSFITRANRSPEPVVDSAAGTNNSDTDAENVRPRRRRRPLPPTTGGDSAEDSPPSKPDEVAAGE